MGEEPATAAAAAASGSQPASVTAQQRPVFTPWGAYSSSSGAGKGVKGGVSKKGGRPQVGSLSVVGAAAVVGTRISARG